MAERGGFELSALPKEVREQLAELELELSEGECGVCVSACPGTGGEERGEDEVLLLITSRPITGDPHGSGEPPAMTLSPCPNMSP